MLSISRTALSLSPEEVDDEVAPIGQIDADVLFERWNSGTPQQAGRARLGCRPGTVGRFRDRLPQQRAAAPWTGHQFRGQLIDRAQTAPDRLGNQRPHVVNADGVPVRGRRPLDARGTRRSGASRRRAAAGRADLHPAGGAMPDRSARGRDPIGARDAAQVVSQGCGCGDHGVRSCVRERCAQSSGPGQGSCGEVRAGQHVLPSSSADLVRDHARRKSQFCGIGPAQYGGDRGVVEHRIERVPLGFGHAAEGATEPTAVPTRGSRECG